MPRCRRSSPRGVRQPSPKGFLRPQSRCQGSPQFRAGSKICHRSSICAYTEVRSDSFRNTAGLPVFDCGTSKTCLSDHSFAVESRVQITKFENRKLWKYKIEVSELLSLLFELLRSTLATTTTSYTKSGYETTSCTTILMKTGNGKYSTQKTNNSFRTV